MTTENKILIGLVAGAMSIMTAIYAVAMKRSDDRDQEKHEAFMAKINGLSSGVDTLKEDE